jgi:hypothetical protein
MPEPNDPIPQACLLGAIHVFFGSPPASIPGSSSAEPFSFGFFSSQAGTTVPLAKCTRFLLLLDQPIYGQLASSWADQ